jgi:uncharacterized protein (TIGR02284 family)
MAERSDAVDVIRDLINTCHDGEKGFKEAADHVKRTDLRSMFLEVSRQRAGFAQELESELASLAPEKANKKKDDGHVVGAIHRTWLDVKKGLGAGDHSILAWLEQGEDYAKGKYEKALNTGLPAGALAAVRRQAQSVIATHDRVREMRDQKVA